MKDLLTDAGWAELEAKSNKAYEKMIDTCETQDLVINEKAHGFIVAAAEILADILKAAILLGKQLMKAALLLRGWLNGRWTEFNHRMHSA